jgi:predicted ribosome quality control (RQC) complex YloA/Tae2 family protein
MAEAALKLVETEEVETKALSIVDQAKAVVVKDSETYTAAGTLWKSIGDMIKEVKETFDPICDAANKAHKAATMKRAQYLDPLTIAQKSVKSLMSAYDFQQECIRKAEEDRLRKIEEARLAEERRIEQERLEAERKAEEDRLLAEAVAAEERGDKETAELLTAAAEESNEQIKEVAAAIAQEPIYVPPVVVQKATPKMAGGPVYREVWAAEVTDIKALCMAVATGKASAECVTGNMVVLNRMAVALKNTLNIPGVRSYSRRV